MVWLEMSRDPKHGGGEWGFGKCLWSPVRKRSIDGRLGSRWKFWENVANVRAGDVVLHLSGIGKRAAFVGFSTAEADGLETTERPPDAGEWGYSKQFYRVQLRDFEKFPDPILLSRVLDFNELALRQYFARNKEQRGSSKLSLFYVPQGGRLQCLNGAYLSEVDAELARFLLDNNYEPLTKEAVDGAQTTVTTSTRVREMAYRVGQNDFSELVRRNFGYCCCFPDCIVSERIFLTGSHIARWADVVKLRGDVSNGLCLCLMHDKAFEFGLFTIADDMAVCCHPEKIRENAWGQEFLLPWNGRRISVSQINPSRDALEYHWKRIGFRPIEYDAQSLKLSVL